MVIFLGEQGCFHYIIPLEISKSIKDTEERMKIRRHRWDCMCCKEIVDVENVG